MTTASDREDAVPFCDLARQHRPLTTDLSIAIQSVMDRGDFILGDAVTNFEEAFASYIGTDYPSVLDLAPPP